MIIDFSFANFRSIKDEQHFSMEAESGNAKLDNTFELTLADGTELSAASEVRLVKSSVVYGANASGKTNFIRAFSALKYLVTNSATFNVDEKIICYEPFELEIGYETKPTKFQISFIALDLIKYRYEIEYGNKEIYAEKLTSYPKGQPALLFERVANDLEAHHIKVGNSLIKKPKRREIFKNQLYLSKFGSDEPNEQLTRIYKYFAELEVRNASAKSTINNLSKEIAEEISKPENLKFTARLSKLIKIADTKNNPMINPIK